MRFLSLVAVLLMIGLPVAAQADDDPAETACHNKESTLDIGVCLHDLTDRWDNRLNTAYKAVSKASESEARKAALLRAERAWVAFRDANCGWYYAQEGTIRQVETADCMLTMTRARAVELEANVPR